MRLLGSYLLALLLFSRGVFAINEAEFFRGRCSSILANLGVEEILRSNPHLTEHYEKLAIWLEERGLRSSTARQIYSISKRMQRAVSGRKLPSNHPIPMAWLTLGPYSVFMLREDSLNRPLGPVLLAHEISHGKRLVSNHFPGENFLWRLAEILDPNGLIREERRAYRDLHQFIRTKYTLVDLVRYRNETLLRDENSEIFFELLQDGISLSEQKFIEKYTKPYEPMQKQLRVYTALAWGGLITIMIKSFLY